MNRYIIEAHYAGDYRLWVKFDDGQQGLIDLADELWGDKRAPLRHQETFADLYLDHGLATVAWSNGAEFSPEFLYSKLNRVH